MDGFEGLGAALFVLVLLGAVLVLLRRRGLATFALPMGVQRSGAGKRMQLLERVPLGPQHALCLVRIGEVEWLAATSPSGCDLRELGRGKREGAE